MIANVKDLLHTDKEMNSSNVIKGFSCIGIWPLDSTKYPLHRFDPRALKKYNEWKESGATELNRAELKNNDSDAAIDTNTDNSLKITPEVSAPMTTVDTFLPQVLASKNMSHSAPNIPAAPNLSFACNSTALIELPKTDI